MCISQQNSNRRVVPFEQPSGGDKRKNHRHITVQHNYHDHSNDCVATNMRTLHTSFEDLPCRGGTAAPFPVKLYEMLERVEKDGFGNVVSWQPHGRCFLVHNTELFKELLPRYFSLTKIPSFQRQLNLYGFMRLTRGMDKGGYYHEMFLRGMPSLMRHIQRVKVKGTGVRARSNPEQEPDFWTMTWVGQDSASSTAAVAKSAHIALVSTTSSSSSGASVVSHHDDDSSSTTTTSRPGSPPPDQVTSYTTHCPQQQMVVDEDTTMPLPAFVFEEESSEDFVMSGWGKPFYCLDSLSEELETVQATASAAAPAPTRRVSAEPTVVATAVPPAAFAMDDFLDDLDLDDLVHDIITVDQDNDGNFLQLLERIIVE